MQDTNWKNWLNSHAKKKWDDALSFEINLAE